MMAGIKGKNTKPEILVRKLLHVLGFRFRLHRSVLAGKPDLVLAKHNAVIFVQGCFWHGHKDCPVFRLPKSRTEFWEQKIGGNRKRDERSKIELLSGGWRVIYVWECALKGKSKLSHADIATAIKNALELKNRNFTEIRGKPTSASDKSL